MNERPQGAVGAGPSDPAAFANLFETCSLPMLISKLADGTYLAANEAFLRVSGYDHDEVIGRSSLDVAAWVDPGEREAMVKALMQDGRVTDAEGRFQTKAGQERVGLFSAQVIDYEGTPAAFVTLRDVTEERDRAEELRVVRERYQALAEHMPIVTYRWDSNKEVGAEPIPYMSPQIEALLGYPLAEWQTDPTMWHAHVHPDDLDRVQEEWRSKRDARARFRSEYRMITVGGATVWVSDEASPMGETADGYPLWQGVLLDITDRKNAEQASQEREGWLQGVFQAAFEGIAIHENGIILEANDEMGRIFGFDDVNEMRGLNALDTFTAPESQAEVMAYMATGSEEAHQITAIHRSGERFQINLAGTSITYYGREARLIVVHDLSDQIAADDALRESEERFRSLVEQIPAVTYLEAWRDPATGPHPDNPLTYISPQAASIFGMDPESRLAYPLGWRDGIHPADKERAIAEDDRTDLTGDPFVIDYRFLRPDGETVWIHEDTRLVRDHNGNPVHWLGVMSDITERMQNEEMLRSLADRLVTLSAIDKAILKATSPQEIAAHAVGDIRDLIACELVSVIQMDADLTFVTMLAIDAEDGVAMPSPGDRIPLGAHIDLARLGANQVQGPMATDQLTSSPQVDQMKAGGIRTAVYLPLFAEDTLLGALTLFSHQEDYFTDDHLDIAREITDQLAVALHQADLHQRLESYAVELENRLDDLRRVDEQRRKLLARLVHAQEEERQRIATDIHDDSIQKMAAVSLRLESLRRKLHDEDALRNLSQIESTVQGAIERLRHLMFELWPPALERHGLAVAVRTELEQTKGASGLDYSLRDEMDLEPPPETRTIAYRIIQEAVTNARKHSEASMVEVRLSSENGGVQVRISDDGKGLEASESPPGHMGLSTMRERAEMAGGWLRVNGADVSDGAPAPQRPTKGTTIEFWLPGPADPVFAG